MTTPVRTERIEEHPGAGGRLGRHVEHDPRSLEPQHLVAETDQPVSKSWPRRTSVLDQGNLGSCTGNALVGCMGTSPWFGRVAKQRAAGLKLDEPEAVGVYSRATQLDAFPGDYPPTDTGSSGLAVAKVALERGWISGYQHVTSLAAAHEAIKTGPFITGVNWYEGFDTPASSGLVRVSGSVRGGHEFVIAAYSVKTRRWRAWNSWGTGWGRGGAFYLSDDDYERLLSESGDATVLVP